MAPQRPFSGHVIFDHLPRVGGTALTKWLTDTLGTGCVIGALIGDHWTLIHVYGGKYPVISGHMHFDVGKLGLDTRYRYITCLREPIDRLISWIFFVVNNHSELQLGSLWRQAERFLMTEGEDLGDELAGRIGDLYVEHFSRIVTRDRLSGAEKLSAALAAIEQYDVWGLYEEFPGFMEDVGALFDVPAPAQIARVNITRDRPAADRIPHNLRKRLEELNELDIELYTILRERRRIKEPRRTIINSSDVSPWQPYNEGSGRLFSAPEFRLISAEMEKSGNDAVSQLDYMAFAIIFSLSVPVARMIIGVRISDEFGRCAFGINTKLLQQVLDPLAPGAHLMQCRLKVDLPEGRYTATFAFVDDRSEGEHELAWYDNILEFSVIIQRPQVSVGYCSLPAELDCRRIGDAHDPSCGDELKFALKHGLDAFRDHRKLVEAAIEEAVDEAKRKQEATDEDASTILRASGDGHQTG